MRLLDFVAKLKEMAVDVMLLAMYPLRAFLTGVVQQGYFLVPPSRSFAPSTFRFVRRIEHTCRWHNQHGASCLVAAFLTGRQR